MATQADDLRDAQVLIIGTGPMGAATARRALEAGAQVTLAGRSEADGPASPALSTV